MGDTLVGTRRGWRWRCLQELAQYASMWTERDDVERAIGELGLSAELVALPEVEARRIYREIEARFADRQGARWIWEHLRLPSVSRTFEDDRAFERLPRLVPEGPLLFFPGSDSDILCAYVGEIGAIASVIADCAAFEYCIAPAGLEWLVGENHHGLLYAVGEPLASRLRNM
jgi:hypothetical protein